MANAPKRRGRKSNLISEGSTIKTFRSGEINYIDASSLHRPLQLPKKFYPILGGVCAVAVVAACFMGFRINNDVVHYDDKLQAKVEKVINRDIDQKIPKLSEYVTKSDDDVKAAISSSEIEYVDMNEINGESEYSLDVLTLPGDMAMDDAAIAYTGGIGKLDAVTGAKLLSGSWRLMITRDDGTNYSLKYADFKSTDPNIAVQSAMEAQGLTQDNVEDEGVDTNGNTFKSGKIDIDGKTYKWTVSACQLKSVYDISGFPSTAQYVGVRYTA